MQTLKLKKEDFPIIALVIMKSVVRKLAVEFVVKG